MVFDATVPDFNHDLFPKEDWRYTPYAGTKESIPLNAPEPCGLGFKINTNVDSDYAGDCITRRSRIEYSIFLNNAPIY